MEAEYIAMADCIREIKWCRQFLNDIGLGELVKEPTRLNCDNQAAISYSRNYIARTRTKHIDIRYHLVREAVEDGDVTVQYIPTEENRADIFTKALPRAKFEFHRELGIQPKVAVKTQVGV